MDRLGQLNDPAFRALGAFLSGDVPLNQALDQLAALACRAVPGCHMASITLFEGDAPTTAVHTHPEPPIIDAAQYAAGRGPCLDAVRLGEVQRLDDTATDGRWPEFAGAALAQGVRSNLALPMVVQDRAVGGFNLFSNDVAAFDGDAADTAGLFAALAGLAVAGSLAYWHQHGVVQHLEEALRTRPAIEQAKGIIIARDGVAPEEAFDILRRASQRSNRKLREIAVEIVERAVQPPPSDGTRNGDGAAG
jgi:GAF domain-containing protein